MQQGFANEEIIPIDTWIETFYQFPLGINSRSDFYDDFNMLGKLERVIWLASQSNKTNMRNFLIFYGVKDMELLVIKNYVV